MSTSPAPASPAPASASPPRNTAVWWILGLLSAAVVLLGLAALLFVTFLAREVRISERGQKVEIQTPVGQIKVNEDAGASTGLPIYPGAVKQDSTGAEMDFSSAGGSNFSVVAAHFRSSDPLDKISDWYAKTLGPGFRREKQGERPREIPGINTANADVAFIEDVRGTVRLVALKRRDDAVEIGLARFGSREAH